jgi:opacity protein-like surface antigen
MTLTRHAIRRVQRCILLTLAATAWTAASAQAQWVVTPYLGINLAGDAEFRRGGPGVSVAVFGGRLGFEFDVERYNHFYKDKDLAHLVANNCGVGPTGEPCTDLNTDAIGYMGNVIVPIRLTDAKNWRPYATAGLGVIHSWVTDPSDTVADTNQNNVAFDFGGGVMYSLNKRVALRGDVRYFLAFVDEAKRGGFYFNDYGFLRATFGVTFGFPR